MGVAIARNSVLILAADTAANVVVGAIPGGLWVPALTLSLNSDVAAAITISPVVVGTDDGGDDAHGQGRSILDRGEVLLNGKAAIILRNAADVTTEISLPVGLLPGAGPYWISVRGVSSNGLGTARVLCSLIAVPFEGAARQRRAGDGASPIAASVGQAPRGSGVGPPSGTR